MKSVLISVHPKWWKKICTVIGHDEKFKLIYEKSVEVRKTRPKLDVPFKVFIYETKATDRSRLIVYIDGDEPSKYYRGCGKVVGEFVCDCITSLKADNLVQAYYNNTKATCLTDAEITQYANGGKLYYWHISNLVVYGKPRKLSEFRRPCIYGEESDVSCFSCDKSGYRLDMHIDCFNMVTRPPQSWCYVESEVQGE